MTQLIVLIVIVGCRGVAKIAGAPGREQCGSERGRGGSRWCGFKVRLLGYKVPPNGELLHVQRLLFMTHWRGSCDMWC